VLKSGLMSLISTPVCKRTIPNSWFPSPLPSHVVNVEKHSTRVLDYKFSFWHQYMLKIISSIWFELFEPEPMFTVCCSTQPEELQSVSFVICCLKTPEKSNFLFLSLYVCLVFYNQHQKQLYRQHQDPQDANLGFSSKFWSLLSSFVMLIWEEKDMDLDCSWGKEQLRGLQRGGKSRLWAGWIDLEPSKIYLTGHRLLVIYKPFNRDAKFKMEVADGRHIFSQMK